MSQIPQDFDKNVFINCPFDERYLPIFNAIVFAVYYAGFTARCALEVSDGGQYRLEKIMQIISDCRYGIHDISRTSLDPVSRLPRFNVPLELGLDLGCRKFGDGDQSRKVILILDKTPHRYQKFISDIAGQDVFAHAGIVEKAVKQVRNWLRTASGKSDIPSGAEIYRRYRLFSTALPQLCGNLRLDLQDLPFVDFSYSILTWLSEV